MILPVLLVAIVVAAAALLYAGLRTPSPVVSIEERLATFAERPRPLEELELERPFSERVLKPLLTMWSRRVARFTPKQNVERVRQSLLEAGSPGNLGPIEFMGLRGLVALSLGGMALLLTVAAGAAFTPVSVLGLKVPGIVLFPLPALGMGYLLPGIWLSQKIGARKKDLQRSLPDAIDLLTISVEAGLGFDPAIQRVAEKWDNALSREFARMLHEMRIGRARRDALRDVATRCAVDDLRVFISSIVQADQLGVSITTVLRVQSEQMRIKRRQRAEELAQKAPIKMIIVMVFLIFPAMYVIILGPAVPTVYASFFR